MEDWELDGRWFLRVRSSGIPAHPHGDGGEPWADQVVDQHWDLSIPLVTKDTETIPGKALGPDADPSSFLAAAAREQRPLGIALNGIPFFSLITADDGEALDWAVCRKTPVDAVCRAPFS